MTPAVKRKVFLLETWIVAEEGSISLVVYELQLMISLLAVRMPRLVKSTAKIVRISTEQNPPVDVE